MGIFMTVTSFLISSAMFLSSLHLPASLASSLQIKEHGVYPVEPDDTVMIFYANVSHIGHYDSESDHNSAKIIARLEMEKCCLQLMNGTKDKTREDCEVMRLVSSPAIVFRPNHTHPLHMYFLNPDLLDRKGSCVLALVTLKNNSVSSKGKPHWDKVTQFSIPFNTVLPQPNLFKQLVVSIGGSTEGFRICTSDNKKALHECADLDCEIRYAGKRSVRNPKSGQCEKTPICEDSSNLMISPVTGECVSTHNLKHVHNSFSPQMLESKSPDLLVYTPGASKNSGKVKLTPDPNKRGHNSTNANKESSSAGQIVCEHGHLSMKNGIPSCACNTGWKSQPVEEWEQEMLDNPNAGHTPRYKMCNVVSKEVAGPVETGLMVMIFASLTVIIPCIAFLAYLHRQNDKKSYKTLMDSSSEDEEDSEIENTPEEKTVVDADAVITEIANRREGFTLKNRKDEDPPPPPSSGQAAPDNMEESYGAASRNTMTDGMRQSEPQSQVGNLGRKSSAAVAPSSSQQENVQQEEDEEEEDNEHLKFRPSTVNFLNPSSGFIANATYRVNGSSQTGRGKRTPSMDEILNLDQNEKKRAHIPMSPLKTRKSGNNNQSVMENYCMVETELNNVFQHGANQRNKNQSNCYSIKSRSDSISSEMITRQKKEEWAQFIQSVSEEALPSSKPIGNLLIQVESPDESDSSNNNKQTGGGGAASKVQSLPEMHSSARLNTSLPQPPESVIQKSLKEMKPEEYTSRQTAYNILNSLSKSRLPPLQPRSRLSTHSIWSNVASENAEEMDPDSVSQSSSFEDDDVRTANVYGDLGSDADSDDALEAIAVGSSSSLKPNSNFSNKEGITEELFEQNRRLYGFPQNQIRQTPVTAQQHQPLESIHSSRFQIESDNIPSDVYTSTVVSPCDSNMEFWKAGRSSSESTLGGNSRAGDGRIQDSTIGHPSTWVQRFRSNYRSQDSNNSTDNRHSSNFSLSNSSSNVSPEMVSAYRIKSSLETALKASRSQSATNFF